MPPTLLYVGFALCQAWDACMHGCMHRCIEVCTHSCIHGGVHLGRGPCGHACIHACVRSSTSQIALGSEGFQHDIFSRLGGFLRQLGGVFLCFGGVLNVFCVAWRRLEALCCFANDLQASGRRLGDVLKASWRHLGGVLEAAWGFLETFFLVFGAISRHCRFLIEFQQS